MLATQAHCVYLSDLRYLQWWERERPVRVKAGVPPETLKSGDKLDFNVAVSNDGEIYNNAFTRMLRLCLSEMMREYLARELPQQTR